MHVLDRRSSARRAGDQGDGRGLPELAVSNRRRTDRRVSATRKRLTLDQLDAIHAGGPGDMSVVRVTYVVNGPCFAWLAEIERGKTSNFIAGAGVLPEDAGADVAKAGDPLAAVILGVRARLRDWHDRSPAG